MASKNNWLRYGLILSLGGLFVLNKLKKSSTGAAPPIPPLPPGTVTHTDNTFTNTPFIPADGGVVTVTPGGGKGVNASHFNNGCI